MIREETVALVVADQPFASVPQRPDHAAACGRFEVRVEEMQRFAYVEARESRRRERALVGVGFVKAAVGVLNRGPVFQAEHDPFEQPRIMEKGAVRPRHRATRSVVPRLNREIG